jgi:hypothetical protein
MKPEANVQVRSALSEVCNEKIIPSCPSWNLRRSGRCAQSPKDLWSTVYFASITGSPDSLATSSGNRDREEQSGAAMTDDERVRLDTSSLHEVDARDLRRILRLDLGLLMRPTSDGIRTEPLIGMFFLCRDGERARVDRRSTARRVGRRVPRHDRVPAGNDRRSRESHRRLMVEQLSEWGTVG